MQRKNKTEPKKLNSICEVQIDGKMSLVSLYDDLEHFEYDTTIDDLKDSNEKLKTYIQELKDYNKKLEKELLHFKCINDTLSKNITSLYKTATSEIQRKDKIIEELRKSQISTISTSKMFSSDKISKPKENIEYSQSSKEKVEENQINSTVDASKELNQNDNYNIINIVYPNDNIPKTVYYKRLCQKLQAQNETVKAHNIMPNQIENNNTNSLKKITLHTNEELKNDSDKLKEIAIPLMHNDSLETLSSPSVVCKSDVISNDCKFDNNTVSPIVQCEKPKNSKGNKCSPLFFSKLKIPLKLKKKMVMSPATIGVKNLPDKTLNNFEKLNKNKNEESDTQCTINNLPLNKTIETLTKDTQPTLINEHKDTATDSKIDDKLQPITNKELGQHLSTSVSKDQILSMEIENIPGSFQNEEKTVEIDNSLVVSKLKVSSPIVCEQLSIDNKYHNPVKSVKPPRENKKKSPGKLSPSINSKPFSTDNDNNKSVKSEKSSTKNENKSFGKPSSPILSEQHSTDCELDKSIKYVKSPNNENKSFSSSQQSNYQSEHKLSETKDVCNSTKLTESNNSIRSYAANKSHEISILNKTSVYIEAEQIPFKARSVKILKDSNTLTLIKTRECSSVNCENTSVDNEFNLSNKHIKNTTPSNENKLISLEHKKYQPEHKTTDLNHKSDSVEFSQLNSSLETDVTSLAKNTSINIEVEQGSIFRRSNSRKVIIHPSFNHDKTETKKGRRVQLITIKNHYSQPLPSFNGAKKKEIDVSKNSIHIEKVVESSSLFYIPQVKRRRTINFSNAES